MNDITTIDTNNYAEMAKAMGLANEAPAQKKQGMFLARLRINHTPILGSDTIKVKGGTYKLEIPDGPTYYKPHPPPTPNPPPDAQNVPLHRATKYTPA